MPTIQYSCITFEYHCNTFIHHTYIPAYKLIYHFKALLNILHLDTTEILFIYQRNSLMYNLHIHILFLGIHKHVYINIYIYIYIYVLSLSPAIYMLFVKVINTPWHFQKVHIRKQAIITYVLD